MRRLPIIILMLFILPSLAWGQRKTGTAGAQFLELGVSARAAGMGEVFLAVADDASALYYNPSGLTQLGQKELILTHVDYIAGITYDFGGISIPTSRLGGVVGLGIYFLNSGDIPNITNRTKDLSNPEQTYQAKEYALALTYARSLTDRFSIGTTLKFIDELYEEERANGWAVDVGTMYKTDFKNFRIGVMMSNFGSDLKFIKEAYPLPINFKFGISMEPVTFGEHKALIGLELSHPNDNLEKFNSGVEYWYRDILALRVGNQFGYDSGDFSFGAGVKLPFYSKTKLRVDYGYHDFGFLSEVHRFTLNLSF